MSKNACKWPAANVKMTDVSKLIPYARNSRTHSPEQVAQIAASIREWGFTIPILTDESGGIIAGHGRLLAAQKLDLKQVPCMTAEGWTDSQKRAYIIADNKLALNAGWDEAALAEEMRALSEDGFNIDLTGFSEEEFTSMLNDDKEAEGLTDPDDAPEPPATPKTKLGDIYILGNHRLMCGDGTSVEAVKTLCEGKAADLWLTDPPYNVAYEGKTKNKLKIQNDKLSDDDFVLFIKNACIAAMSAMKDGAAFYIWHANNTSLLFETGIFNAGLSVRQHLVWLKNSIVMGQQDYHYKHEPCLYGWKDGAAHFWGNDRKQTSILDFDRPQRNGEHPTMKPVALFEYQMMNNTKAGDVVLDSFGGSGTTMIAAEKNGRRARIMELDPKYCDVIVKRWEDFTGKKAELLENISKVDS